MANISLKHPGVHITTIDTPLDAIASAPTSVTLFIGRTPLASAGSPIPTSVDSFVAFQQLFGALNPAYPLTYALWLFFNNGGAQALVLSTGTGATTPTPDPRLAALAAIDTPFDILILPPDTLNGDLDTVLLNAALALCVQQRAMLLIDAPVAWSTRAKNGDLTFTPADLNLAPAASLSNCALYFPRIEILDPLAPVGIEAHPITLTAAPAIAAIWATTDTRTGVWESPAGQSAALNGIASLATPITDTQQGPLNLLGINCLRTFPTLGTLIWGARTLSTQDSNYRYISVRRLALFIESSLLAGLAWTAFKPNDESLWAAIGLKVSPFLTNLWQAGAIAGPTPDQAFFIRRDASTTQDIDNGIVNIFIGIAPIQPGEFVIIPIQLLAATPNP
ncbi:hypothetical protein GOB94_04995 [Granulicella sp. 5B5]|uniref:phage tail sheath family protein n=1 Tax=Granulicella sp. 5B5 TaxID=1617967 RepID=UPI0015F6045D|nr:phage tail sheath C-terminal domain-containing protein [Granulicella sp. 5B5]QMV18121.1 hypothetical protein GOB94_04995 [Granulicella sp. 5B5]